MRTDVAESWSMLRDAALARGSLSHEARGCSRSEVPTLAVTSHSLSLTPKPGRAWPMGRLARLFGNF